ncbi:MAG: hypothetical protein BWY98_00953 [Tenericutes bacterium ADurb.BinA155]|nr:MAG: hypothetical protein BWY98_00953 [Tenericutes bacterium ADurb.BinA155]
MRKRCSFFVPIFSDGLNLFGFFGLGWLERHRCDFRLVLVIIRNGNLFLPHCDFELIGFLFLIKFLEFLFLFELGQFLFFASLFKFIFVSA